MSSADPTPAVSLDGEDILITGGLGFVGSNLACRCLELGARVTVMGLPGESRRNLWGLEEQVEVAEGDVRDTEAVERLVEGKSAVFHLAGQTSHLVSMEQPHLDLAINCGGTLNVLEAARKASPASRVLVASTVTASGPAQELPADESQREHPVNVYDANKLLCEKYCAIYARAYGLHAVALRFANIFGERQKLTNPHRGILNFMIGRAILGEPITVYGDGATLRDYNYVQNIVDACLLAVCTPETKGQAYVVGSGRGIAFKDMVTQVNEAVRAAFGHGSEIVHVPFPEGEERLDAGDYIADASALRVATGWTPRVEFEAGLAQTVAFYKEHGARYLEDAP